VISNGKRYRTLLSILARHGFDDIVWQLSGKKWMRFFQKKRSPEEEQQKKIDRWIRFRLVLEELGPTYIKFGQILSNRPGLLPDDLVLELSKLQDAVPAFSFEEVIVILEREFQKPYEDIFQSIEKIPIASASIAQVHKAVLKSGEVVAVKVQRPGIEDIINADLLVLSDIASLMMRSQELSSLRPKDLLATFKRSILEELDFRKEASHILKFYTLFEGDSEVKIPQLYPAYCNSKVITLEFIDGIKINRTDELKKAGYDLKRIAQKGFDAYFKQIFEWGDFHADPHPGNLMVLPGEVIGILDFGMVGRLSENDRLALVEFIIGLGRDDTSQIVENVEKLQGEEIENKKEFEKDMTEFINEYGSQAVKDIDLNAALNRGRNMVNKHNLKLNPDLFLLLRTVSMLEGLGISLDPDFRSLEIIKPYALKLVRKNLHPKNIFKSRRLISALADLAALAISFPSDARKIVDKIKNDKLKVQVEDKGLKTVAREINHAGKRIGNAILFLSLFLGGCYLASLPFPKFWGDLNLPASMSFIAALVVFIRGFVFTKH
jgi:ubiquinone biosynthesis protein